MREVKQILRKMIAYANEPDEGKLSRAMTELWVYSTLRGVGFAPNRRLDQLLRQNPYMDVAELEAAKPVALQKSLRSTLDAMVNGESVDIDLGGRVVTHINKDGSVDLHLRVSDSEGDDNLASNVMVQLMLFSGIKAVKKCQRCGSFILIDKSMKKKFCSNNCRQRSYQNELTPKQKLKQAMRRSGRRSERRWE